MINIMIVEDNPHNMRLIEQIVLDVTEQFNITKAVSGAEALNKAEGRSFKIVLMDIALPDISGVQICKELKKLSTFKNTIFIAVTAYASKYDRARLKNEFDFYITKPIDEDRLIKLLCNLLKDELNES